ncbi:MAG: hypothetical protein AAFO83_01725 [Cyanobacteria bacterium J06607_13]
MATLKKTQINFDRKASVHARWEHVGGSAAGGEFHKSMSHKEALQFLKVNSCEAFVFRIDPMKSAGAAQRIIDRITALGFEVEDSNIPHYTRYAWR